MAYREIFGLDLEEGAKKRRCGNLGSAQQTPSPSSLRSPKTGKEAWINALPVLFNKTTKNPPREPAKCVRTKTLAQTEKSHENLNSSGFRRQNNSHANESRMSLKPNPELLAES